MGRVLWLVMLAIALAGASVWAQDGCGCSEMEEGIGDDADGDPEEGPPAKKSGRKGATLVEEAADDPSTPEYLKALDLQRSAKWIAARNAFRKFIEKYPDSPHRPDAEIRSGENAYLGCTKLWESGPSERRIDVSVMGDGFTITARDQKMQETWAKDCMGELWSDKVFAEYRNYLNVYFVRLASLEEGVDHNLGPEQKRKIEERNRRRHSKVQTDFSTAIDCKALGPNGQVQSDRDLVYKWLDIANEEVPGCGDDRFVIAFARFGILGMGGSGIANVGRPDEHVVVHEFGHGFARLADEYAVNPLRPDEDQKSRLAIAANVSLTDDPAEVPWAHLLKKRLKGVGIFEGGGTHKTGVWRAAKDCAMNNNVVNKRTRQFCPVCREAVVLVIYEHVNPIDTVEPANREVQVTSNTKALLSIAVMRPWTHSLKVKWYVARLGDGVPEEPEEDEAGGGRSVRETIKGVVGSRGLERRGRYAKPPEGERGRLAKVLKGSRVKPTRHQFQIGQLKPGRYRVTVEVRDRTGWVVRDPKHLLEERVTWVVKVLPKY